ncbi:hypothetical protein Tsubulata_040462 [Turnera subulata]|uniref:Uncharacterized protein n=1 Tax=Turnera subulata TaxID=218843 RepID=A0A9Q0J2A9_9ROSI|nr:hypothetical protein Tsubulata_040462 [Turnera subulata]
MSTVETLKCVLSLAALARIWRTEGVTEDNRLSTTLDEVMALLSGFAGVYTEAIMKKRPSRNGVLPWILIYYSSHDSQSRTQRYCCIHGNEVC